VLAALHKNASLLAAVFLAVHIVTAVADSFAPIRIADAVIPFVGRYRPVWLGFGALGFDLLVALVVTSLLRERLGYRAWRAVHWAAYLCWPVAFLHGLGTGSDTRAGWGVLVNVGCLLAVLFAIWWRVGATRTAPTGRRVAATLTSLGVAFALVAWMVAEPMRPGWARRAGTPTDLLVAASSSGSAVDGFAVPFTSSLQGSIGETDARNGRAVVTIDATLASEPGARLHLVVEGPALDDGGVAMRDSAARLVSGTGDPYRGHIADLNGDTLVATVRDPYGRGLRLDVQLVPSGGNRITGSLTGRTGGSSDDG
jgi:methionine sulfoxide reductase heme-binding subunit